MASFVIGPRKQDKTGNKLSGISSEELLKKLVGENTRNRDRQRIRSEIFKRFEDNRRLPAPFNEIESKSSLDQMLRKVRTEPELITGE